MLIPVLLLTPAMRAALDHAAKVGSWTWHGPAQKRMALRLQDSGLLSCRYPYHMLTYRVTAAGKLALSAKPDGRAWWFATDADSVRAVRRLRQCKVCGQLGSDLPSHDGLTAHGACLVRQHGWPAIVEVDEKQLGRFRVQDLAFLGVSLADVEAARAQHRAIR